MIFIKDIIINFFRYVLELFVNEVGFEFLFLGLVYFFFIFIFVIGLCFIVKK